MAQQKIDSLTSLRFFAAAAIVGFHARGHFGLPTNLFAPYELSQGVSFFFVLSGFILAFVYPNLDQAGATGKFWLARFARVWPLHLACLLLYVLFISEFKYSGPGPLLANLGLIQAWIPNQSWYFSYNAVSWSISTEAFFYLSFPLLIKNFDKTWPVKLGFCFLLVLASSALANWCKLPLMAPDGISLHWLMYINPLGRLFEFVLGMTVAHFYRKYLIDFEARPIVGLAFEVVSLASVYLLTRNTVKIAHWFSRLPCVQEAGRMWLEHGGVPLFSFALLIAVMAWGRGPIARLLRWKPLVLLGEISFATYLLHRIFLHYYWEHFAPYHGLGPIAGYIAILLSASFVFWSIVEVPCRQLIVRGPAAVPRPSLASGLALTAVLAIWFGIWSGAPLERLTLSDVRSEIGQTSSMAQAQEPLGDIAFGDDLLLLAAKTRETEGGLAVTFYWQALKQQQLNNYIGVQLLSQDNTLVRLKDYRQSLRAEVVEKDDCFKNEIFVPASELQYVHSLAFGLVHPIGPSPPARILPDRRSPDRPELLKGLVAIQFAPPSVAGKQARPAL